MVSSLTKLFCLDQGSNVQIRSNENVLLSGVNGQIPASFLALFASFSHHNSNKIRKKRRRIAWDSNQSPQDGSTQLWLPKLQGKRLFDISATLTYTSCKPQIKTDRKPFDDFLHDSTCELLLQKFTVKILLGDATFCWQRNNKALLIIISKT